MSGPIICFGQQPSGIFPKRFLYSKFLTALRLQRELGGRLVFFYHDADHDPRETMMELREKKTGRMHRLNFEFENQIQKRYTPLYLKRVALAWKQKMMRQLPQYVSSKMMDLFGSVDAANVADFCLSMYRGMGFLDGVEVVKSSDKTVRENAIDIEDHFVDVPYEGEVVRARKRGDALVLHKGGNSYIELPEVAFEKHQISPCRDTRLRWMQSVIGCTHYVAGASEINYMNTDETPEITFVPRDPIEREGEAYVG